LETKPSNVTQLVEHLFRHETGKIISVLTRIFGSHNIDLAEDVVQDTLLEAMKVWNFKGVPENPTAWLYKVAKNKALNIVNRQNYERKYSEEVSHFLKSEWTAGPALDNLFSETEIHDDQLRMMFTCCHPEITPDSQVALTLKTLCGFSIPEIARAFLTTEDTINKRLVRARQKIREAEIGFEVPAGEELSKRLNTVLETIYLLFNEGYNASSGDALIRYDLCGEAIRLAEIASAHPALANNSNISALLALMFFNASRFESRQDKNGNIIPLSEQDRSAWDTSLQQRGFVYFQKSMQDDLLSIYHILAAISAVHCVAPTYEDTDWKKILDLYNKLVQLDNSPVVFLNRAVALEKVKGSKAALEELDKLRDLPSLQSYHLFYSTMAEFYMNLKKYKEAKESYLKAIELCALESEKDFLLKKLSACGSASKENN